MWNAITEFVTWAYVVMTGVPGLTADVKSVTWSPTERIVLRGTGADSVVQVGVERGFLDFLAAVEERVPTEVRGSAVETARRAVLGSAAT